MEARLIALRAAIGESEQLLEEAKGEFSKKRSRLGALSEMHARREGMGAGVKALIETKNGTLAGLLADRIEASAELTGALAGLLGTHVEDVVVEDLEAGVALLADLASQKKGRATIVARHPQYIAGKAANLPAGARRMVNELRFAAEDEALVVAVVGDTVVVDDVAAALAFRADCSVDVPVVTMDGTVFHVDGRVSGGTGEQAGAHMLDVRREMRELTDDVARLETLVAERLAHHQNLRTQIGDTQGALDRARQQAHQDELALVHAEKDLTNAEAEGTQHQERLEALTAEIDEIRQKLEEADADRALAQATLDEARAELAGLDARIAEAEATATERREATKAQQEGLMERKVALAGAREKLTASRATLQRLAKNEEELTERSKRLEAELTEGAAELGQSAAMLMKHREQFGNAQAAAKTAQEKLAEAKALFEKLRNDLGEREGGLKDLRTRADDARAALGTHELALRERELAMEHLLQTVREKFRGLELGRVVGDYHMRVPPDAETRTRITELAGLIDRMGAVNLDATREYEDSEKRYTYYTTQKADLDQAVSDLEKAISADEPRIEEALPRDVRGGQHALPGALPEDVPRRSRRAQAHEPGGHARDRHRHHRAAAGQEALEHRADERR